MRESYRDNNFKKRSDFCHILCVHKLHKGDLVVNLFVCSNRDFGFDLMAGTQKGSWVAELFSHLPAPLKVPGSITGQKLS